MTEEDIKKLTKHITNVALIQSRALRALVRALGMYSSNMQNNKMDLPLAYDEEDFLNVIKEEQVSEDSVLRVLNP
jgi:hypothetical protein